MSHNDLIAFIAQKREEGVSDDEIAQMLRDKEWREDLIIAAIAGEELPEEEGIITPASESALATMPTISERLKRSWSILADRIMPLSAINLAKAIATALAVIPVVMMMLPAVFGPTKSPLDEFEVIKQFQYGAVALLISILVLGFVFLYIAAAETHLITRDEKETAGAAFGAAGKTFLGYGWVSLMYALAVLGGSLLLIVPGVIAFMGFIFAPLAFYLEGTTGQAALKRSWEVFRSDWSYAAGNILLVLVGGSITSNIVSSLSTFAGLIVAFFIISPFQMIYIVELYRDLVKKMK